MLLIPAFPGLPIPGRNIQRFLTTEDPHFFRLYQLLSQKIRTRFGQPHEARLLFIRQWKMYVAQIQAQNKHSREAKGCEGEMNKRKLGSSALCAMLLALCASAEAQQPGKIFRIGFLDNSTASGSAVLLDAFRQELSKLGWIEGKNITIEYRF